jgi:phosphopantothenoylcysteine synthetase/decarboxylase
MHCLVTAGPTYEPLDAVRRLTNVSTGALGSRLANDLVQRGHYVTLLLSAYARHRREQKAQRLETFTTTADLGDRLRQAATQPVDAVFHAAAVSDFTFGRVWERQADGTLRELHAGKLATRAGTLLVELTPTPKLIAHLREWFPRATLVGWKFEVDGTRADALAKAERQLADYRTDACVVNGPAYGEGFGVVRPGRALEPCATAEALFGILAGLLARPAA